jgi:hypothetical protein
MPGAVYSPIAKRLDAQAAGLLPLHVGDTCQVSPAGSVFITATAAFP